MLRRACTCARPECGVVEPLAGGFRHAVAGVVPSGARKRMWPRPSGPRPRLWSAQREERRLGAQPERRAPRQRTSPTVLASCAVPPSDYSGTSSSAERSSSMSIARSMLCRATCCSQDTCARRRIPGESRVSQPVWRLAAQRTRREGQRSGSRVCVHAAAPHAAARRRARGRQATDARAGAGARR